MTNLRVAWESLAVLRAADSTTYHRHEAIPPSPCALAGAQDRAPLVAAGRDLAAHRCLSPAAAADGGGIAGRAEEHRLGVCVHQRGGVRRFAAEAVRADRARPGGAALPDAGA